MGVRPPTRQKRSRLADGKHLRACSGEDAVPHEAFEVDGAIVSLFSMVDLGITTECIVWSSVWVEFRCDGLERRLKNG